MKVIVIGSGIVGASVAYDLVRNNVEVILIDEQHEGKATLAGAGIVCPWTSKRTSKRWYEMARAGARYYSTLTEQLSADGEDDYGYKKVGAITVSTDKAELDALEKDLNIKLETTPEICDIKRLANEEARELFPLLNNKVNGLYVSGGARVDGRQLSQAMKNAAIKRGAKFIEGKAELLAE